MPPLTLTARSDPQWVPALAREPVDQWVVFAAEEPCWLADALDLAGWGEQPVEPVKTQDCQINLAIFNQPRKKQFCSAGFVIDSL